MAAARARRMLDGVDATYNLGRFLEAQAEVYARACIELRAGLKQTHWMWFIFPQIRGLGSSPMAVQFAISGLPEARAYLAHEVLGGRLREATRIVLGVEGRTVDDIFGYPDNLKFYSSMTLFAKAEEAPGVFAEALQRYFHGAFDQGTIDRI